MNKLKTLRSCGLRNVRNTEQKIVEKRTSLFVEYNWRISLTMIFLRNSLRCFNMRCKDWTLTMEQRILRFLTFAAIILSFIACFFTAAASARDLWSSTHVIERLRISIVSCKTFERCDNCLPFSGFCKRTRAGLTGPNKVGQRGGNCW